MLPQGSSLAFEAQPPPPTYTLPCLHSGEIIAQQQLRADPSLSLQDRVTTEGSEEWLQLGQKRAKQGPGHVQCHQSPAGKQLPPLPPAVTTDLQGQGGWPLSQMKKLRLRGIKSVGHGHTGHVSCAPLLVSFQLHSTNGRPCWEPGGGTARSRVFLRSLPGSGQLHLLSGSVPLA